MNARRLEEARQAAHRLLFSDQPDAEALRSVLLEFVDLEPSERAFATGDYMPRVRTAEQVMQMEGRRQVWLFLQGLAGVRVETLRGGNPRRRPGEQEVTTDGG